jgi:hypothetical protein
MAYVILKYKSPCNKLLFYGISRDLIWVFTPKTIHVLNEIKAVVTAEIVSSTLPVINPTRLLNGT